MQYIASEHGHFVLYNIRIRTAHMNFTILYIYLLYTFLARYTCVALFIWADYEIFDYAGSGCAALQLRVRPNFRK